MIIRVKTPDVLMATAEPASEAYNHEEALNVFLLGAVGPLGGG